MSTLSRREHAVQLAPPLRAGDRFDQPAFHARDRALPQLRAELIQGVVSMPSPLGMDHGRAAVSVILWLGYYAELSQGVEPLDNATVILDGRNEVQPDATLRVRPGFGGRTRDEEGFVVGAPELVVEIAGSSRYIDLGPKYDAYERAGVLEYVVRALEPDEIHWYTLHEGRYASLSRDGDGLYRSRVFPGLWLDPTALLAHDTRRLREVLDLGGASPEHAEFVERLARAAAGAAPRAPAGPTA